LASRFNIVADPNERGAHKESTPTGAGIVFALVWLIAVFLTGNFSPELFALIAIGALGWLDDFNPLPWQGRLVVQLLCVSWVIYSLELPSEISLPLAIESHWIWPFVLGFALLWFLNLYNFMDGIDGIAATEACFALLVVCAFGWHSGGNIVLPATLLACCAGFLMINWPSAKVFMGDIGSGFLGLAIGAMAITEIGLPLVTWFILLGWFIADATTTLLVRFHMGDRVYEAHSKHAYQHLNRALGTQNTLLILLIVNVVWLLPLAVLSVFYHEVSTILLLLALLPLAALHYWWGAGQEQPIWDRLKANDN
ncbi:MAG: glycosyl transferase, partial [Pseudomonadota bacterium]